MRIYADTSFLVSLYSPDANSTAAVRAVRVSAGERFVTILGELELLNAFGLRVFRKEVTEAQAQSSLSDFEKDLRDGLFLLRGLPTQFSSVLANCLAKLRLSLAHAPPTSCT